MIETTRYLSIYHQTKKIGNDEISEILLVCVIVHCGGLKDGMRYY